MVSVLLLPGFMIDIVICSLTLHNDGTIRRKEIYDTYPVMKDSKIQHNIEVVKTAKRSLRNEKLRFFFTAVFNTYVEIQKINTA